MGIHKVQRPNLAIQHNITNNYSMLQVAIVLEVKIMEAGHNLIQAHHQTSWEEEIQLQTHLAITWWTNITKWTLIRCHMCHKCSNSNKTIIMVDNPTNELPLLLIPNLVDLSEGSRWSER